MKNLLKFSVLVLCLFFQATCLAKTHMQYEITGVNNEILQNIHARVANQLHDYPNNLTREQAHYIYQQVSDQIHLAVQPYGYFKSNIHFVLVRANDGWKAIYSIQLGPPLMIKTTAIQISGPGRTDPELQKLLAAFPLKPGAIFNTLVYTEAKDRILEAANERGYIKASIAENQIRINLAANQASILIHYQTGERYYFGPVTFATHQFDERFLERIVSLHQNEAFSSQKLMTLQQAMMSSPYFSQVILTPDYQHIQDQHVPIQVSVAPPKSQKYNVGIGYGTFTGARLSAGVNLRNLTNTGQHFDGQFSLSSVISGLVAKYYIPGKNPLTDQWYVGANVEVFTPKNVLSKSSSVFGGYETKIYSVKTAINLNYLVERYRIDPAPIVISRMLYPKLNLYYVDADDLINPSVGKSLEVTLQTSSESILSSTSFMQGDIKGKWVFSPFVASRFIVRGDVGYTLVHNIESLPATLRFYAGELNGLRGFPDSSIGPGRYLTIASLEYQHQLYHEWYGAVFYDAGRASDHINDPFNQSNGIGIIYKSMLGPIKLYGAHALHTKSRPYSIDFSIGPEF